MKKTISAVMFALLLGAAAHASDVTPALEPATEETLKPHVGIMLGFANPTGPAGPSMDYGVDVGIQPYIPFSIGLQLSGLNNSDASFRRTNILAKGAYNFGGTTPVIKSSFVGLKTGPVVESDSIANRTDTRLGIGPMVGFDIPITPSWTLGSELAYLAIVDSTRSDMWSFNGAVKYWF